MGRSIVRTVALNLNGNYLEIERMTDRILIKQLEGHIQGYGLISDLNNGTWWGLTEDEQSQYSKLWTEFEQDDSLPPYCVGEHNPGLYDIEYVEIPKGTLYVYGNLKENICEG